MFNEQLICFSSGSHQLQGILSSATGDTAVLIITGGPQYRAGSHRQFVKQCRALAKVNIPSLRFDVTGMGDSEGPAQPFYRHQQDIAAAIAALQQHCPQVNKIVLWGLCDAASASLLYLYQQYDSSVQALVLMNPWVRQQQSHAQTMLKHYYWQRLISKAFWQKVFGGRLSLRQSWQDFTAILQRSRSAVKAADSSEAEPTNEQNYVSHMLQGWQAFKGKVLLITSGNDLTAQEFLTLCQQDANWQQQLQQASHHHLPDATHTFSSERWRRQTEQLTVDFIQSL
ncbi:hydrolase 1, exosortase A system-associated [Chromatiaceae bacterium AAb-1]|nr:hydrolase 1, exosortase A system-associated [Chromatiaceae bacterium AAb-1]